MSHLLSDSMLTLWKSDLLMLIAILFVAAGIMAIFTSVVSGWLRRSVRTPVTKGQLHLFDDDGEGHFLSAKMSTSGLEQLLKDLNQGRFG